jgi:GNAT superfamily N-acetyltransferase
VSRVGGGVPQSSGRTDGPPLWYLRGEPLDTGLRPIRALDDGRHPDGAIVDGVNAPDAGDGLALWSAEASPRGLVRIRFAERAPWRVPPLWFVFLDEPDARRPAAHLVAYESDRFEPGTVVSQYTYRAEGIDSRMQVGAVRWYRDGLVHQVFVRPDRRRGGIATGLVATAGAFHISKGWSGRVHADGRRTAMGELFVRSLGYRDRIAAMTELMPPMDPA